ncbi:cystathionine beta-lyase [Porphyrobacter sp. LM 6]|uniref:cystathionine beta-lyase n=1 Tax=Porphyrobacter sp. LM 6 TaxID=1896196 RepID=UPI0008465C4E|nr:cystathionine beta-lyase [Porphyrobacter sp. LM 6]AOL94249.1 cystathionine beta-lyase [Porphyrobacter sp. LM 6]
MSGGGDEKHLKPATRLVRGGRRKEWTGPVVNPPVWRASTHLYDKDADRHAAGGNNADGQFFYGRRGAPTQWALADALTAIEADAYGTVLYPSGVAAIAGCMLAVLKPGDRLLMADNAYDPSRNMATGLLTRMGVETTFFDPRDLEGFRALCRQGAKAVWLECPGSLTFEVSDIPALAAIAREHGAVSMVDNTWASPLGFSALTHGCDIVMMSLSKHVGGHSDLMMGSASAGKRWYTALRRVSQELGQVVSPDDAALAARGLRTMGIRLEAQTRSALAIATRLEAQPQVARVMCPLLPSDPGHALWRRDFTGGCGLFSFVLASDDPQASARVADALDLFGIGYSWGGFESLALPIRPEDYRSCMQGTDGKPAIRLSIGLEDTADLIADLAQALARV